MRIKYSSYLLHVDFWVLVCCLLLLRLPVALGFRQQPIVRMIFILPIVLVSFKNIILILLKSKIKFRASLLILFIALSLILVVSFVRTALSGLFPITTVLGNLFVWVTIALFGFSLFASAPDDQTRTGFRRGIFLGLNLYLILNMVLYLMGFQSPVVLLINPVRAAILGNFGINVNRVLFPTAVGMTSFGTTAGVGLIASLSMITTPGSQKIDKFVALFGVLSGMTIMLLTDSRAALAFSGLAILLLFLLPKFSYTMLKWLPAVTPFLPLILLYILGLLPDDLVGVLSRSGSDLANMSNRLEIWDYVLQELESFRWIHLIGFGYRGQVLSGLSLNYSYLFQSYASSDISTAHNFLLQSILEVGYIGSVILIIILVTLMRKLALAAIYNVHDFTPKAMLFTLVFLVLVGITEAIFSPDFQEIFTIFLLIWAATGTLTLDSWKQKRPTKEKVIQMNPLMESA